MLKPWPFQETMIRETIDYMNSYSGKRLAGINVAPTGTGKSLMIAQVVQRWGKPVVVLQPSKELLEQNYKKYEGYGGLASIFSASAGTKMSSSCTFATPGSVVNHGAAFRHIYGVETLIIDECHFKVKTNTDEGLGQVKQFIEDLQPKWIIGFTATPVRLVTDGMGPTLKLLTRTNDKIFHDFINVVQIQDILEYWKKIEYKEFDFDEGMLKYNSTGSDFTEESVKAYVLANNVNNNILIEARAQLKEGKKAILIFCDAVENGYIMEKWFNETLNEPAVFVSGKTPKKEREEKVNMFTSGKAKVMINHSTFTTGFDYPALDCVMIGRPTNSFSLLYQIIGRLVRRHAEIMTGLCIDFGNNMKRLGYIEKVNFENLYGYGWGMFNDEYLMSDRPLKFAKKTKKDLLIKAQFDKKTLGYNYIHFGSKRGMHVSELSDNDLLWYKRNISDLRKPEMQMFYDRLQKEGAERNLF